LEILENTIWIIKTLDLDKMQGRISFICKDLSGQMGYLNRQQNLPKKFNESQNPIQRRADTKKNEIRPSVCLHIHVPIVTKPKKYMQTRSASIDGLF
jgi:hypothetical protein